jgi:RNA polymerase sigma factor (sigma-70 family)
MGRRDGWPDAQVIRAAQGGDRAAILALVEASHPHVRRFAHALCPTPQDAEDAAQEALIVLYRKVGTLRAAAALASWMFQIVQHECIRRARLLIRAPEASPAAKQTTEEAVMIRLEVEQIIACVAELPPEQREVLVLRDIRGLSGAETARKLGLERAAMKSRLHRARATVRGQLDASRRSDAE